MASSAVQEVEDSAFSCDGESWEEELLELMEEYGMLDDTHNSELEGVEVCV